VGEYVPFYFCARSIMLYVIHCANHPGLTYRGGQTPIVHLQADLHAVVAGAAQHGQRWAFTTANAGAYYAPFHASVAQLNLLDWVSIDETDFRDPVVKEAKQSEFLVHGAFSVAARRTRAWPRVTTGPGGSRFQRNHRCPVRVARNWPRWARTCRPDGR
jgi:hypothetical protein